MQIKIQALLKEKKFHLKKSLRSVLHQATQLFCLIMWLMICAWSVGKYDNVFLQSSLLMTMIGELRIIEGSLSIKGSVGYVAQQAWVFSGSVKQNILFGQAFEEDRYDKVVRACCLEQVRIWFSFYQHFSGV